MSLESKMDIILKKKWLKSSTETLAHSASYTEHTISLEMLESVARMRYCLRVAAELLKQYVNEYGATQSFYGPVAQKYLEETRYNDTTL